MPRHNVQPTGQAGSYHCTCGATFGALAALQAHITQARSAAEMASFVRTTRKVVQLVVEVETLLARRHKPNA